MVRVIQGQKLNYEEKKIWVRTFKHPYPNLTLSWLRQAKFTCMSCKDYSISRIFKQSHPTIDKEMDMPLAFYMHLSRWEQNDHIRFGALFITFPKSQIILFTILSLFTKSTDIFFWVRVGDFFPYCQQTENCLCDQQLGISIHLSMHPTQYKSAIFL